MKGVWISPPSSQCTNKVMRLRLSPFQGWHWTYACPSGQSLDPLWPNSKLPLPVPPLQVQKSAAHYTEAAQDEITLCSQIRDGDPLDDRCCVRMYDSFEHGGPHGRHTCMVFEVLGENLLALIKRYDYRGIPLPVVRNLSRQMLIGLDYIHRWGGGAIQVGEG